MISKAFCTLFLRLLSYVEFSVDCGHIQQAGQRYTQHLIKDYNFPDLKNHCSFRYLFC